MNLGKLKSMIKSEWKKASKAKKVFLGYCVIGPFGFYLFPIYLGIKKLWKGGTK